jgi:hypothetical protein
VREKNRRHDRQLCQPDTKQEIPDRVNSGSGNRMGEMLLVLLESPAREVKFENYRVTSIGSRRDVRPFAVTCSQPRSAHSDRRATTNHPTTSLTPRPHVSGSQPRQQEPKGSGVTAHSIDGEPPLLFPVPSDPATSPDPTTRGVPAGAQSEGARVRQLRAAALPRARTGWQAGYQARLRLTDAVVVGVTLLTAYGVQLALSGTSQWSAIGPLHAAVGLLLATAWLAALATNRAYDVRFFGRGMSEYQRVLDATWKSFSLIVLIAWVTAYSEARTLLLVASRSAWSASSRRATSGGSTCCGSAAAVTAA